MTRNEVPEDIQNHGPERSHESRSSSDSSHDGVLSRELRENFEAMKAVWRQAGRHNGEEAAALEELKRKEREQAIETALTIDSEITMWQNGIAELEAMLAAEEDPSEEGLSEEDAESSGDENAQPNGYPLPAVRFPSLPPVVVPDDEEDKDDSTMSRSGSSTDLDEMPDIEHLTSSG